MAPSSLKINLTEPVVVLPALDSPEYDEATLRPTGYAVRGLLSLTFHKPTRITLIEVDLTCRATTAWPDGTLHDGKSLAGVEQNILYVTNERLFDPDTDTSRGRSILRDDRSPSYTPTGSGSVSASGSRNASRNPLRSPMISRPHSPSGSRPRTPTTPIERLGRLFGMDSAISATEGTLFEAGTYNYPIFLKVPLHLPQTVRPPAQPASVTWIVSARVGRAGKKKLSSVHEIQVVRAPPESDQNVISTIERNWETQLRYRISIPFHEQKVPHSTTMGLLPFEMTLIPLEKVKIMKLTVALKERVAFFTKGRQLIRHGDVKHITLLSLENLDAAVPLLPFVGDNVEAFRKTPLGDLLGPGEDPRASLMGTAGPWIIKKDLHITSPLLSATHMNEYSNVDISHVIQVVIRVKRGDVPAPGLFDVQVEIPYSLVSDRLSVERSRLPEYREEDVRYATALTADAANAHWTGFGSEEQQLEWHMRFERLMSGREDITGDIPPAYERRDSA